MTERCATLQTVIERPVATDEATIAADRLQMQALGHRPPYFPSQLSRPTSEL